MKKLLLVVTFVCVLSVVLGSSVYAATSHQQMKGTKLIGYGPMGLAYGGDTQFYSSFTITNPNCTKSITINRLSIVQANGTVIYEGPFVEGGPLGTDVVSLQPHGVVMVELSDWVSLLDPMRFFTVEVGFRSVGALPLIGHSIVWQKEFFADGTYTLAKTRVAMEKM